MPVADGATFALLVVAWALLPPGVELVPALATLPAAAAEAAVAAALTLPHSRACELEADAVGVRIAAAACYDPARAAAFWRRLEALAGPRGGGGAAAAMLSTHPPDAERAERLRAALPEALEVRRASPLCAPTPAAPDLWARLLAAVHLWVKGRGPGGPAGGPSAAGTPT
jgi:hypothetical protein